MSGSVPSVASCLACRTGFCYAGNCACLKVSKRPRDRNKKKRQKDPAGDKCRKKFTSRDMQMYTSKVHVRKPPQPQLSVKMMAYCRTGIAYDNIGALGC